MNRDIYQKNYPIKQINVSSLENYLRDRGWTEEFRHEEVIKFKSPRPFHQDKYMEVFIPSQDEIAQEDLSDYKRSIEIAIEAISVFEKRCFEDVLSQLLIFGDLLKFQISTQKTKKGSIPIDEGIKLYNGISNLLIYSACAEIKLQKSFLRSLKNAKDLIETVKIGQSEYGSFVANVQCELKRPRYFGETNRRFTPLGRTTILRILKGIKHLNESVQGNTAQPIINNYNEGFNANMCDTLIDIIDIGENNDIIVSASLEPAWEIPENISTCAIITPYARGFLQEASDKLWGEEPEERHELKGYVFLLRSRPDDDQKLIRILASDEENGETFVVEVEGLDAELYHLALNAHDTGKLIKIAGILKKIGKKWILDNPEYLRIIQE